ncbi:MAG TPA: hypothetical protein VII49_14220 [Rhizomicrobium sp.]
MIAADFNVARTKVDVISLDRLDDIDPVEELSRRYGLPHLLDFLRSVKKTMEEPEEAFGRRYQRDAIRRPGLVLISPASGRQSLSTRSIALEDKIFFRFCDDVDFYAVSSRVRFGYPLGGLFVPRENWILSWDRGRNRRLGPTQLRLLKTLLDRQHQPAPDRAAITPAIIMGHENFAHHMWNELSALERFLADGPAYPVPEILTTREPLGPLHAIFPEISGWKFARLNPDTRLGDNDPSKLYVNLGGYRIPSALKSRIVRYATRSASPRLVVLMEQIRACGGPVFWLSVRIKAPTLVNQKEVVAVLCAQLMQRYRNCCIVLDGFSLPFDWKQTGPEMQQFYRSSADSSRKEIDALVAEITDRGQHVASQMIVNAGGFDILDSIALGQIADMYFCHSGTTQHKIAWTANLPGIIHCNSKTFATDPAQWHAERLEGAIRPDVVPSALLADTDGGNKRGENYRAVDPAQLADFVMQKFGQYPRRR